MESISRRDALALSAKAALALGAASFMPGGPLRAMVAAASAATGGLSDPSMQPMFETLVPNALGPDFRMSPTRGRKHFDVAAYLIDDHDAGLVGPGGRPHGPTMQVFAYGQSPETASWPGRTFEVQSYDGIVVEWANELYDGGGYAQMPIWTNAAGGLTKNIIDTSMHWCYALPGYEHYSAEANGVPLIAHLHGGHNNPLRDGNPEYFYSPGYGVTGPRWSGSRFNYGNTQGAGTLWYHDHALGITRLTVHSGLAGFYIVRDDYDTGLPNNPLGLPAGDYELAYAIQDRMFTAEGQLFFPSFPGDPLYADFITDEEADLPPDVFPGGGPTGLAEFFGDHITVNGKVWPKTDVERRLYRVRLLNGCDSRFLVMNLHIASPGATTLSNNLMNFTVIGSDQGRLTSPRTQDLLVIEPGARYDLLIDFSQVPAGSRVIMGNIGGDEPFGGDIPGHFVYGETDRIMAFDVANTAPIAVAPPAGLGMSIGRPPVDRVRKLALFEGKDEYGRLQPLLGTAEPATTATGEPINWPDNDHYAHAGLVGQIEGAIPWHSPTTENPAVGATEEWQFWNCTGDAHPVHVHLVNFEVTGRREIIWDSATNDDSRVLRAPADDANGDDHDDYDDHDHELPEPNGDGTYLVKIPVVQHNGLQGIGFKIMNPTLGGSVYLSNEYVENAPKDMVIALPDQAVSTKMTFDKPGRFVWHCHILSHEDHEMMRPLEVGGISGRGPRGSNHSMPVAATSPAALGK